MTKTAGVAGAILLACAAGALGATEVARIPFPRGGTVPVDLASGPMRIRSVTLKNAPSPRAIRKARHEDRDDTVKLRWVFHVSNAGRHDWNARIRVAVYSADDRLLAESERGGEVNRRKMRDQISVWTKMLTRQFPQADHVRIEATFEPD